MSKVSPYGTVEITHPEKGTFKVNGHRLKYYYGEDIDSYGREEFDLQPIES